MNVFVLDNYDSFTFNLVQYLGELGADVDVARNDKIDVGDVERRSPDAVVISPGPGVPSAAGISVALVRWCAAGRTPLLGVCLGHQAIAEAFGARIVAAPNVMHGKTSPVLHNGEGVFSGLPQPIQAMRYHSLVVERESLASSLAVTAWTEGGNGSDGGVIMGVRHRELPIEGVQFHPESILTAHGKALLSNFLRLVPATAAGVTRRP